MKDVEQLFRRLPEPSASLVNSLVKIKRHGR